MPCNTCGLDYPGGEKSCVRCGEPLGKTYFDVLGVSEQATTEEIRTAYRTKIRGVHPDFLQHLSPDLQRQATLRATQLNKIAEVLSDPGQRQSYREELVRQRAGPGPDPQKKPEPPPNHTKSSESAGAKTEHNTPPPPPPPRNEMEAFVRRLRQLQVKLIGEITPVGFGQGAFAALVFVVFTYATAYGVTWGAAQVKDLPFLLKLAWLLVFCLKLVFSLMMVYLMLSPNKNGRRGWLGLAAISIFFAVGIWQIDFQSKVLTSRHYAVQKQEYAGLFEDIKRRLSLGVDTFVSDPAKAAELARAKGVKEIPADKAGFFVLIQNSSNSLIKDTAVSFDVQSNGKTIYQHSGIIPGKIEARQTCGYVFWVAPSSREFRELSTADLNRASLHVQKLEPLEFGARNEWIEPVNW